MIPIRTAQPRWKQVLFANPWRTAFWVLLGLLLLLLIAAFSFWLSITRPQVAGEWSPPTNVQDSGVPIEANISLEVINQYLEYQLTKKQTPVQHAQLIFEQQKVRLDTTLTFFGRTIDMKVWMRPEVQENGDLRLISEQANIGRLAIPQRTLFTLVEGMPFPAWIHMLPEQQAIEVRLSERPNAQGLTYRVDRIDWDKQSVLLDILLPHK